MSELTRGSNGRPIRTDQWQPPRGSRVIRADSEPRHRHEAGEYGEGRAQDATGVGPRRANAEPQVLNDRPGNPDNYGNVAAGAYGTEGYSGEPGHPSHYAADSGVPGAQGRPSSDSTGDALSDDRLRELIRERLTEDPDLHAADVTLEVQDGRVTLTGSVDSQRTRDVVEQCVENCGARAVDNRLSVR